MTLGSQFQWLLISKRSATPLSNYFPLAQYDISQAVDCVSGACMVMRRDVLTDEMAVRLKEILTEIGNQYGFNIIAQEIMPDHVHMLVEAPPKYAPATIARTFKSISARELRAEFLARIKKHIWREGVLWASGYYVASVADGVTTEIIKEYIETKNVRM